MKSDFIIALTQLAAERNLPREIVLSAIEAALVSAYKRDSVNEGTNISVKLDPGSGDVQVFVVKTVVEEIEEPLLEITLKDARKINPDIEIGGVVPTEELPHSAGRIAAQTAKQVVIQRLREAERDLVVKEFEDKEGEVFTVTVQRTEPRQIVVELGRAEAILPISEQAQYERYRIGQKIKILLQAIQQTVKGPELIVSRADKLLLKRLFEMEVPEIYNGSVEIIEIAREAGSRSKVAVWAKQEGVDAVGSCVGLRGIRIQNIVNELHGEKIDVVEWSRDPAQYIANALSPATVLRVDIDQEETSALAVVPERQISLAIGKDGQNARLGARLTGWKVDIKSDVEMQQLQADQPEAPADAEKPAAEAEEAPAEVAAEVVVAETAEPVEAEPAEVVEEVAATAEAPAEVEEAIEEEAKPEVAEEAEKEAPPQIFVPEIEELEKLEVEEEAVPVGEARSLREVSEDIWNLGGSKPTEGTAIRFAEDIEDVGLGAGGGRRGGRRRGGARSRRGPRRR